MARKIVKKVDEFKGISFYVTEEKAEEIARRKAQRAKEETAPSTSGTVRKMDLGGENK